MEKGGLIMSPKRTRAVFYADGRQYEIYAPPHFKSTWKKFLEICERDSQSASGLLRVWVEGYVHRKDPGNPQRPITAYAPGHEDEYARLQQDIFSKLLGVAEDRGGHLRWLRIVEEIEPLLSGHALVDAAEKLARRLTKAGVRVVIKGV